MDETTWGEKIDVYVINDKNGVRQALGISKNQTPDYALCFRNESMVLLEQNGNEFIPLSVNLDEKIIELTKKCIESTQAKKQEVFTPRYLIKGHIAAIKKLESSDDSSREIAKYNVAATAGVLLSYIQRKA